MEWQDFIDKLEEMRKENGADLVIWTAHNQQVTAIHYEEEE